MLTCGLNTIGNMRFVLTHSSSLCFFKVYFSNCLWICYMLMNETESFVTTKKIRMSMNHMGRQGKA